MRRQKERGRRSSAVDMKAGRSAGRTAPITRPRPLMPKLGPRRRPRSCTRNSSPPCNHVGRGVALRRESAVIPQTWPELRRRRGSAVLLNVCRAAASRPAAGACSRWAGASQLHCWHLWETGRGSWRARRRLGNGSQATPDGPCGTAAITQTSPNTELAFIRHTSKLCFSANPARELVTHALADGGGPSCPAIRPCCGVASHHTATARQLLHQPSAWIGLPH